MAKRKPDTEQRDQRCVATEVRLETREEGGPSTLMGLAAPYYDGTPGTEYQLAPMVVERYMPGAFADALAGKGDVMALLNHDDSRILGRQKAGTLRLRDTPQGLAYEIDLGKSTTARDTTDHVTRGEITGSSCSWNVVEEKFVRSDGAGPTVRELHKLKLYDVSPVTFPAYQGTNVSARSQQAVKEQTEERELELMAMAEAELNLLALSLVCP